MTRAEYDQMLSLIAIATRETKLAYRQLTNHDHETLISVVNFMSYEIELCKTVEFYHRDESSEHFLIPFNPSFMLEDERDEALVKAKQQQEEAIRESEERIQQKKRDKIKLLQKEINELMTSLNE